MRDEETDPLLPPAQSVQNSTQSNETSLFFKEFPSFLVYFTLCLHLLSECVIFPTRRKVQKELNLSLMKAQLVINAFLFGISSLCHIYILKNNLAQIINGKTNSATSIFYSLVLLGFLIAANIRDIDDGSDSNQNIQIIINFFGYGLHVFTFTYFYEPPQLKSDHRRVLLLLIRTSIVLSVLFSVVIFLSNYFQQSYSDDVYDDTNDPTNPAFLSEICLLIQIINLSHHYYECAINSTYFNKKKKKVSVLTKEIDLQSNPGKSDQNPAQSVQNPAQSVQNPTPIQSNETSLFPEEFPSFLIYFTLCLHLLGECVIFPIRKYHPDRKELNPLLMKAQLVINAFLFGISFLCHIYILNYNLAKIRKGNFNSITSIFYSLVLLGFLIAANIKDIINSSGSNQIFQLFINFFGYGLHVFTFTYFYGPPLLKFSHRTILLLLIRTSIGLSVLFSVVIFLLIYFQQILFHSVYHDANDPAFLSEICLLIQMINLSHRYYESLTKGYFEI